jgi:hypothetical protein
MMNEVMKKILGLVLVGICFGAIKIVGSYIGFAIIVLLLTLALYLIIGTD